MLKKFLVILIVLSFTTPVLAKHGADDVANRTEIVENETQDVEEAANKAAEEAAKEAEDEAKDAAEAAEACLVDQVGCDD